MFSENEDSEGRFDSAKFAEMVRVRNVVLSNRGLIAPNFLKGFVAENWVLSNRCAAVVPGASSDNKEAAAR